MSYPDIKAPCLRTARSHLERVPAAEPAADSEQHDLAPRSQPAVHRGVSRRPESRVRARAAVARIPDRSAGQLLPAVLGRVELRRPCRAQPADSSRKISRTSRRCTAGRRIRRWARTTIARQQGGTAGGARHSRRSAEALSRHVHLRAEGGLGHRDPSEPARSERRDRRGVRGESPQDPRAAVSALQGAHRIRTCTSSASTLRSTKCAAIRGWTRPPRRARWSATTSGWFFVIQEAVGEPRFGLDADAPVEPSPEKWDNLAWAESRSVRRAGRRRGEAVRRRRRPAPIHRASSGEQRRRHGVHPLPGSGHGRRARPQHAREPRARGVDARMPQPETIIRLAHVARRRARPRHGRAKSAYAHSMRRSRRPQRAGRETTLVTARERARGRQRAGQTASRWTTRGSRGEALSSLRSGVARASRRRTLSTHCSDQLPFVLLPVRIETVVRAVADGTRTLRVRFFPDDIGSPRRSRRSRRRSAALGRSLLESPRSVTPVPRQPTDVRAPTKGRGRAGGARPGAYRAGYVVRATDARESGRASLGHLHFTDPAPPRNPPVSARPTASGPLRRARLSRSNRPTHTCTIVEGVGAADP